MSSQQSKKVLLSEPSLYWPVTTRRHVWQRQRMIRLPATIDQQSVSRHVNCRQAERALDIRLPYDVPSDGFTERRIEVYDGRDWGMFESRTHHKSLSTSSAETRKRWYNALGNGKARHYFTDPQVNVKFPGSICMFHAASSLRKISWKTGVLISNSQRVSPAAGLIGRAAELAAGVRKMSSAILS